MVRGTTPTHIFELPVNREYIKKILITYCQKGNIILEKRECDVNFINDTTVSLDLTQRETFMFDDAYNVEIEFKALDYDNKILLSQSFSVPCGRVLNQEVLE